MNNSTTGLRIAIVGGGFSGISLAANLYQLAKQPLQIFLIDSSPHYGTGVAFSTTNPIHLLNVRAKDMSAFQYDEDHFIKWLMESGISTELNMERATIKDQFIPRYVYARYLRNVLSTTAKPSARGAQVNLIQDRVIGLTQESKSLVIHFQKRKSIYVDKLVLAHGHLLPECCVKTDSSIKIINNPWHYQHYHKIPSHSPVLIMGTGLTMIDAVLQLKTQDHQGKIYAISRRGLTPIAHENDSAPYILDSRIFSMSLRDLCSFVRSELERLPSATHSQQALFRALRLQANMLWSGFTLFEQKQFLLHVQPYWDQQRHRVADQIATDIAKFRNDNSLELMAGRIVEITKGSVIILPRRSEKKVKLNIDYIINCTGPGHYSRVNINPLIDSLISQGLAKSNELSLGIEVSSTGALVDRSNKVSKDLYTLGPPRKGKLFECTTVKDIRIQSIELAKLLLRQIEY